MNKITQLKNMKQCNYSSKRFCSVRINRYWTVVIISTITTDEMKKKKNNCDMKIHNRYISSRILQWKYQRNVSYTEQFSNSISHITTIKSAPKKIDSIRSKCKTTLSSLEKWSTLLSLWYSKVILSLRLTICRHHCLQISYEINTPVRRYHISQLYCCRSQL